MQPITNKIWRPREADPAAVDALTRSGFPALLARLLANRGIDGEQGAKAYLSPVLSGLENPMLMKGMAEAVERLALARTRRERVCVHGDYDVDGVTASALLIGFFRAVGIDCFPYIPKRLTEGYGLSPQGVAAAARGGRRCWSPWTAASPRSTRGSFAARQASISSSPTTTPPASVSPRQSP